MTFKEVLKALAFPTENPKHDPAQECWQRDQGWVCRGQKSCVHGFLQLGARQVRNNILCLLSCSSLFYLNIKKPGVMKCIQLNEKWEETPSFCVEYPVSCSGCLALPSSAHQALRKAGSLRYPWVFREILSDRRLWCAHLPKMSRHHRFCCSTLNAKDSLKG